MPALLVGFGLSLSSTPLVLQLLAERGATEERARPRSVRHSSVSGSRGSARARGAATDRTHGPRISHGARKRRRHSAKLLGVMAAIVVGGRLLLRPALRVVARIKVTEVFTAAALLTVIATALLAREAGLSMSLGAFLAGVLLADSEFRHELEADLEPFKGLLLGLFFIAVGMAANLGLLQSEAAARARRDRPDFWRSSSWPSPLLGRRLGPFRTVGVETGLHVAGRRRIRVRVVHAGRA